jgi:hypothetical protein
MIDRREFLRKTAVAAVGVAVLPAALAAVEPIRTPIVAHRYYARLAIDNHVMAVTSGKGAFDDLSDRIMDKLWSSWADMEIQHQVGG